MSHFVRFLSRKTHEVFWSSIQRNFQLHTIGIIPGGGLGKLQGIKEEEYFTRQDHKLFENMQNSTNQIETMEYPRTMEELRTRPECICSVKHKNLTEEAYFLTDHCDCLKLLQAKSDRETEE